MHFLFSKRISKKRYQSLRNQQLHFLSQRDAFLEEVVKALAGSLGSLMVGTVVVCLRVQIIRLWSQWRAKKTLDEPKAAENQTSSSEEPHQQQQQQQQQQQDEPVYENVLPVKKY